MVERRHAVASRRTPWIVTTLGGLGLIVGCGTLVLQGVTPAFSTWSATPVNSQIGLAVGTVAISLPSADTTFSVGASGMVPGDTVERAVAIQNSGTVALSTLTLAMTDAAPTALDNSSGGLTMSLDGCTVPWTQTSLPSGGYSYTCSGTVTPHLTNVVVATVLNGPAQSISGTGSNGICTTPACLPGGEQYLMVQFTVPSTAPSTDQGLSDTIGVTISGVQRNPTAL